MPANLTPQYYEAEKAFKEASSTEEKIQALKEMLSVIPKHKGTERLQGEIKKKLARLKLEGEKKSKSSAAFNPYKIEKVGAGQILLLGFPNVGKSSIVGALSNAKVVIAEYPFSTPLPLAGMAHYQDVQIQLIDTPPLIVEDVPGELIGAFQRADRLAIVIDCGSPDSLEQLGDALAVLEDKRVVREEIPEGVKAFTRQDIIVLANKIDLENAVENLAIIKEFFPELRIIELSVHEKINLDKLPAIFFEWLQVIRVYSKVPGKAADMEQPFILPEKSTVLDMAEAVHQDIAASLEKARIWGSAKFDGQSVSKDHILKDKDIIELHS